MHTIRAVWTRLRASGRTGTVRVMCFDEAASAGHLEGEGGRGGGEEQGLSGLVDVSLDGDKWGWDGRPPLLCFGEPRGKGVPSDHGRDDSDEEDRGLEDGESGGHVPGCGHSLVGHAWDLYERIENDLEEL